MNIKQRKLFDSGLYFEGIKQLRLVGILFGVILALEALLKTIVPTIIQVTESGFDIKNVTPQTMTGISAHPLALAVPMLVAPIMVFYIFSFLNKRNTADFYHSLPHTRTCLFISYFAAVCTWMFVILAVTGAISATALITEPKFYSVIWSEFLIYHLSCFIAALLAAAAAAIAMTITGTTFTNIVLYLFILLLPRYLITLVNLMVSSVLPMLTSSHSPAFLSYDINIMTGLIFGTVFSMFGFSSSMVSVKDCLFSTGSIIYTAVVAVAFTALACLLFNIRKSESAARSAPNRTMQAVYRIMVTMLFCSAVVAIFFSEIICETPVWAAYAVCAVIAVVIYFAYELITTKKFRNLLRVAPGLAVVAGLCVALFGIMYATYSVQLNYVPSASEIVSVSPASDTDDDGYYMSFAEYAEASSESVNLTDKELIKFVAESLSDNTSYYKEHGYNAYCDKYVWHTAEMNYNGYPEDKKDGYISKTFKIKTSHATTYRTVYFKNDDSTVISAAISRDSAYRKFWMTLPAEVAGTVEVSAVSGIDYSATGEQAAAILQLAREELNSVSFDKWYETANSDGNEWLDIRYNILGGDASGKGIYIPVFTDILPKTSQKFAEYAFAAGSIEDTRKLLEDAGVDKNFYKSQEDAYFNIYLNKWDEENGIYQQYPALYGTAETGTVEFIFSRAETTVPDIAGREDYVSATVEIYSETVDEDGIHCYTSTKSYAFFTLTSLTDEETAKYFEIPDESEPVK